MLLLLEQTNGGHAIKNTKALQTAIAALAILLLALTILSVSVYATSRTHQQTTAHEIAQLARSIGLPESDPIIVRAKELWDEDTTQVSLFWEGKG